MQFTAFCFTVSPMSKWSYQQCVFQKKHMQQSTSVYSRWTCSMWEKWTFVVWKHWIVRMFVITAKATLALFYSTFLYCSSPYFQTRALLCNRHAQEKVHIILSTSGKEQPKERTKRTTEGKDKVTGWSSLINHRFFIEFFFFHWHFSFFTWLLDDWLFTHTWYRACLSLLGKQEMGW